MTDIELLKQYQQGSQAAFAELVRRHIDWVYSAALRRVHDAHLAEDVAQAVFIALSRNEKMNDGTVMSAWLFAVMRFTSAKLLRSEGRRRNREAMAVEGQRAATDGATSQWSEIAPVLEDAVARLGHRDREAVLLRFYQRLSWQEVGTAMGISDEGARKRVARAVGKLRGFFAGMEFDEELLDRVKTASPERLCGEIATAVGLKTSGGISAELAAHALRVMRHKTLFMAGGVGIAAIALVTSAIWLLGTWSAQPVRVASASTQAAILPVAVAAQPANVVDASTRPSDITMEQLIAGVRKAETAFQNLHIKNFRTTVEVLPDGQAKWQPNGRIFEGSAWFDENAQGNKRVYFSKLVMPWIDGAAPWSEEESDCSWNGTEGRYVRFTDGKLGHTSMINFSMIGPDVPALIDSMSVLYVTGLQFTTQYWTDRTDYGVKRRARTRLSDQFQQALKIDYKLELATQKIGAFDAIRITFKYKNISRVDYWFDPSRSYSLVKWQRTMYLQSNRTTDGLEVQELKEVKPGIWFPVRASETEWGVEDLSKNSRGLLPGYTRYNFKVDGVIANDSNFDASIFSADIPVGYLVNDDTKQPGQLSIVMPDGHWQVIPPGSRIPRVPVDSPERPDGN